MSTSQSLPTGHTNCSTEGGGGNGARTVLLCICRVVLTVSNVAWSLAAFVHEVVLSTVCCVLCEAGWCIVA